ncbi:hypothetical protein QBC38DRAFT_522558 [Podospora fimiseda]|uniref:Uncharacterized protein n=1 Tax=Podospora fimiseda TaxID=252190 RepID=A0AAN7BTY0_9PEZI|nr:hypothetical protein QBC38DRAFT_522558 [Podospora fimiseda]
MNPGLLDKACYHINYVLKFAKPHQPLWFRRKTTLLDIYSTRFSITGKCEELNNGIDCCNDTISQPNQNEAVAFIWAKLSDLLSRRYKILHAQDDLNSAVHAAALAFDTHHGDTDIKDHYLSFYLSKCLERYIESHNFDHINDAITLTEEPLSITPRARLEEKLEDLIAEICGHEDFLHFLEAPSIEEMFSSIADRKGTAAVVFVNVCKNLRNFLLARHCDHDNTGTCICGRTDVFIVQATKNRVQHQRLERLCYQKVQKRDTMIRSNSVTAPEMFKLVESLWHQLVLPILGLLGIDHEPNNSISPSARDLPRIW